MQSQFKVCERGRALSCLKLEMFAPSQVYTLVLTLLHLLGRRANKCPVCGYEQVIYLSKLSSLESPLISFES